MKKQDRVLNILQILKEEFPDAHCELNHSNAFELLVATVLSAQCTDVRVNMVTPHLFKKYPTPAALSKAKQADVEEIIKSTGFYKNKATNIIAAAKKIMTDYQGQIPKTMDELILLPGVGRKTANVVLGNAFNINYGVVVDTHVKRISNLLQLTKNSDPEKIEQDLIKIIPQEDWTIFSHLIIFLGRKTCKARNPNCNECSLSSICPSAKKKP